MRSILIVEDERNLANVIRDRLREEGYRVLQAFDGPSALTMARDHAPDLIVLDILLPSLDGLEVCRRLRAHSIVPILMLTARAEEIDRVLGLELGADDYVTKPFSMHELRARVRALLRRVEMMQAAGAPSPQAVLLEQILVNLVTNGLRFTPEGGIVTVEAEAVEGMVEVRVIDTGIGIPPEDLDHIFERSYRGDQARAQPAAGERLSSGSGLGLSIVKGLVEAMGDAARATSVVGEGTCIAFRLPTWVAGRA